MRIGDHDYEVLAEGNYLRIHFEHEDADNLFEDIELASISAVHTNMTDIVNGRLTNCWILAENTLSDGMQGERDDMLEALTLLGVEPEEE